MARYALVFLAAAVLCTAVLAQDVVPAHRGNNGGIHAKYSVYDSNTQRYRPVKCGRNLCLYRIHARLIVETYNRNQPNPATFATTVAVYTGSVQDYTSNVTTGTFEVTGIATTQPAGPTDTLNVLENQVLEFGPERDDALTVTGNTQINPVSLTMTDSDMAVTGGTGQFMGAFGSFADRATTLSSNSMSVVDITIFVPSTKL